MTTLAPVARPSTQAAHDVPGLDAVRGLAAFAVLGTHVGFATGETTSGALGAVVSRLDFGVAIFFLLSGFLLFRPWVWYWSGVGPAVSTRSYAIRRALRILPLYWLVLAVVMVSVPANRSMPPGTIALNVGLLQIYVPDSLPHALTQAWSLATEASFYLALPFIAALVALVARPRSSSRSPASVDQAYRAWHPVRALVILAALAVAGTAFVAVVRAPGSTLPTVAGFWLPHTLAWFCLGMALAVLQVAATQGLLSRVTRPMTRLAPYLGTCWTVAALAYLLAATPIAGPRAFEAAIDPWGGITKLWLYGMAAFFILLPLVMEPRPASGQVNPVRRALQSRVARWFGDTSYGVFLWHLLLLEGVLFVLGIAPFSGGFWIVLPITYAASLAVSFVTFRLLERPMNQWARRATSSSRRPTQ